MKSPHRRVDLVGGAGDADDVTSVLAEIDVALDDAQGSGRRAPCRSRGGSGRSRLSPAGEARQLRRRRASSRSGSRRAPHWAAPTCQYQPDSGSSKRGIADGAEVPVRIARRDEIGGERVGVDQEALVEGALGVVAVERRQDQPRDQQDHEAPEDAKRPQGGPRWTGPRNGRASGPSRLTSWSGRRRGDSRGRARSG